MALPKITLTAGTSPTEGAMGSFLITLDAPAPEGGLTVDYTTAHSTATKNKDYTFTAGENLTAVTAHNFTIAAGATTATLNLVATADKVVDLDEIVRINVAASTSYDVESTVAVFSKATELKMGTYPQDVTVADLNGDGNMDLVAAGYDSHTISVRLGKGDGSFTVKTDFWAGRFPTSVVAADFNGDGNEDLAVTNNNHTAHHDAADKVSVLLGDGNGGFAAKTDFEAGGYRQHSITVADFNGDGNTDLAMLNHSPRHGTVSVLLGDGSGGFTAATVFHVGNFPRSVIVADFNGDGNEDLVTTSGSGYGGKAAILLGDGSGGFAANTYLPAGTRLTSATTADFNGDGNADLATTASGRLSVLLGNGNGGFAAKTHFHIRYSSYSVTAADFNGDGNADLVTTADNYGVSVLLGNGKGDFAVETDFKVSNNPGSVTAADFNGDGNMDLVTANNKNGNGTVAILLNANIVMTGAELSISDDGLYKPRFIYGDHNSSMNDALNGGLGADRLYGYTMADTLFGGTGNDMLSGDSGADSLLGGWGNDLLLGGVGHDKLRGNKGNDILYGGIGHDVLTGGSGSDIFKLTSLPVATNVDKITDFSVVDDTIQLVRSTFTQLSSTGVLDTSMFVIATTAHDSNDYVIYNPTTGALFYDADGSGAGAGVQIATIGVNLALTAADFVVV